MCASFSVFALQMGFLKLFCESFRVCVCLQLWANHMCIWPVSGKVLMFGMEIYLPNLFVYVIQCICIADMVLKLFCASFRVCVSWQLWANHMCIWPVLGKVFMFGMEIYLPKLGIWDTLHWWLITQRNEAEYVAYLIWRNEFLKCGVV